MLMSRPVARLPPLAASWTRRRMSSGGAVALLSERRVGAQGVDRGDALDPVLEDALDSGLERHGGSRATAAGSYQLDVDHARGLLEVDQGDVATVGLEGGTDGFD